MKHWFYPLVMAVCALVVAGCSKIKDPEFRRLERIGVRNVDLEKAIIGFSVVYFNPNNFGVGVKEAEIDLYADSLFLGKYVQEQSIAVNKNAEFSIPFIGQISFRRFQNLNPDVLSGKSVLLRAEGSVKVGKAGIYISKAIRYSGRHQLNELNITP